MMFGYLCFPDTLPGEGFHPAPGDSLYCKGWNLATPLLAPQHGLYTFHSCTFPCSPAAHSKIPAAHSFFLFPG